MFIDMKARCFMEAAECLSFTRAAERLYITQPALSKNIAALEQECGMKLFYRDHRKNQVALTPRKMNEIMKGVLDKAKRAESGEEGHLTVALPLGQIINETTADLLHYISENFPRIEIKQIQGDSRQLLIWLEEGSCDMIVTFEDDVKNMTDIIFEEVEEVNLGFAVPIYFAAAKKRSVKLSDIAEEKFILPDEEVQDSVTSRFRHLCRDMGLKPETVVSPDLNQMNMMAEMGSGILVTREDSIVTRSPNLKFFKSRELGRIKLVAAWRKDNLNPIITFYHRMYENLYLERKQTKQEDNCIRINR